MLLSRLRRDVAVAELEAAVAEYLPAGAPLTDPNGVELLAQLSRACMLTEQHERAIQLTDRALAAAERLELIPAVADLLITRGTSLSNLGRAYEGVGAIRAGLELAEQQGLLVTAIRARLNIGVMLNDSDPRAALDVTRTALDMAKRLGRRSFAVTLIGNAASAAVDIGDWDWVVNELRTARDDEPEELGRNYLDWALTPLLAWRGEDVSDSVARLTRWAIGMNETSSTGAVHGLVAEVALGALDFRTVHDEYLAFALSDRLNAPRACFWAGFSALMLGDAAAARAALDLHIATGVHGRLARLDQKLLHAGIVALEGQSAAAIVEFGDALAGYRDLGVDLRLAAAGLLMANVLDPTTPEVRSASEAARSIFARLGGRPFSEALERALSRPTAGPARRLPAGAPAPVSAPCPAPPAARGTRRARSSAGSGERDSRPAARIAVPPTRPARSSAASAGPRSPRCHHRRAERPRPESRHERPASQRPRAARPGRRRNDASSRSCSRISWGSRHSRRNATPRMSATR